MKTCYPLHGESVNNVTVRHIPKLVWRLLPAAFKDQQMLVVFGAVWAEPGVPIDMTALIMREPEIAFYARLLKQSRRYPVGGLGWLIEYIYSKEFRLRENIPAWSDYLWYFVLRPVAYQATKDALLLGMAAEYDLTPAEADCVYDEIRKFTADERAQKLRW